MMEDGGGIICPKKCPGKPEEESKKHNLGPQSSFRYVWGIQSYVRRLSVSKTIGLGKTLSLSNGLVKMSIDFDPPCKFEYNTSLLFRAPCGRMNVLRHSHGDLPAQFSWEKCIFFPSAYLCALHISFSPWAGQTANFALIIVRVLESLWSIAANQPTHPSYTYVDQYCTSEFDAHLSTKKQNVFFECQREREK